MDSTLLQQGRIDDWEMQSTNEMVAMRCRRELVEEDMVDDWIYLNLTVVLCRQGCVNGGGDVGSSGDDVKGGRWFC